MAGVSQGQIVGGKYRLEAPIGQGGMASVWRAVHTTLESPVAVKFLETFGSTRDAMAKRFLREAKLAAGLRHRNVVHILDHGVLDDGQPFMVMELLAGTSLADRFDQGPALSEVELLEIAAMVLSGLAAVHDAGIVHRDVKPENIFLVRDADGDYAKLLDFGISRGVDTNAADTRMTNTGAVVGTPLYMSPEQARGLRDLDQRTDLWSIGMVLYEGLTGELPFDCENMGDILVRVVTEDVPRLERLRPDLPPEIVDLVHRALSRDREKRFATAREMREAVIAATESAAMLDRAVRPRSPNTRLSKSRAPADLADTGVDLAASSEPRRARGIWIAGGLLGALVVLGAIAFVGLGAEIRFAPVAEELTEERSPSVDEPPAAASPSPSAPTPPSVVARPVVATTSSPVASPSSSAGSPAVAADVTEREPANATAPVRATKRARRIAASPGSTPRAADPPAAAPAGARRPFLRDLDY